MASRSRCARGRETGLNGTHCENENEVLIVTGRERFRLRGPSSDHMTIDVLCYFRSSSSPLSIGNRAIILVLSQSHLYVCLSPSGPHNGREFPTYPTKPPCKGCGGTKISSTRYLHVKSLQFWSFCFPFVHGTGIAFEASKLQPSNG